MRSKASGFITALVVLAIFLGSVYVLRGLLSQEETPSSPTAEVHQRDDDGARVPPHGDTNPDPEPDDELHRHVEVDMEMIDSLLGDEAQVPLGLHERLIEQAKGTPNQEYAEKTAPQHLKRIEELRSELAAEPDDCAAASLLLYLGTEYGWLGAKTPPETSERKTYAQVEVDAFASALEKDRSLTVSSYYLAMARWKLSRLNKGEGLDTALEQFLRTYDMLAESETHLSPTPDGESPHLSWLVRSTMEGVERCLASMGRADEFRDLKIEILRKYQGTILGRQLAHDFGWEDGRRLPIAPHQSGLENQNRGG